MLATVFEVECIRVIVYLHICEGERAHGLHLIVEQLLLYLLRLLVVKRAVGGHYLGCSLHHHISFFVDIYDGSHVLVFGREGLLPYDVALLSEGIVVLPLVLQP